MFFRSRALLVVTCVNVTIREIHSPGPTWSFLRDGITLSLVMVTGSFRCGFISDSSNVRKNTEKL